MKSLKGTKNLIPGLYEDINKNIIVLVNSINSNGFMRGMVVYSEVSEYEIGDNYAESNLKLYIGEITLSN